MIRLTRINRVPLVLNSDLIEHVEITPDTVIAMTSGQKFMVLESADQVIQKVIDFKRMIANRSLVAVTDGEEKPAEDPQR
jgi:flagellar protein FlbD